MIKSGLNVPTPAIPMPAFAVPYAAPAPVMGEPNLAWIISYFFKTYSQKSSVENLISSRYGRVWRQSTYCSSDPGHSEEWRKGRRQLIRGVRHDRERQRMLVCFQRAADRTSLSGVLLDQLQIH